MQEINKLYEEFNNEKDHFKKSNLLHKLTKEYNIKLADIGKNINSAGNALLLNHYTSLSGFSSSS